MYLIPLWGGCAKGLMKSFQTLQNKAARAVSKMDWHTPTSELLRQCGWMSVHQLSVYHTVILAYKVMQAKSPKYLYTIFNTNYSYETRQAYSGMVRSVRKPELEIAKDSFREQLISIISSQQQQEKSKPFRASSFQPSSGLSKMIFTISGAQVYHPLHILGWRFSAAPTKNTVVQYYL